jgi:hypothetical protein
MIAAAGSHLAGFQHLEQVPEDGVTFWKSESYISLLNCPRCKPKLFVDFLRSWKKRAGWLGTVQDVEGRVGMMVIAKGAGTKTISDRGRLSGGIGKQSKPCLAEAAKGAVRGALERVVAAFR